MKIICVLLWFSIAISKDFCTEDSLIGMKSKFTQEITIKNVLIVLNMRKIDDNDVLIFVKKIFVKTQLN